MEALEPRTLLAASAVVPSAVQQFSTEKLYGNLLAGADGSVYVNFLTQEEGERVRDAYGENYERLVALKNKYDPKNVFGTNQNIKPTV